MISMVMGMKNSKYWRQRFETLEKTLDTLGQEAYFRIEPTFEEALHDIEQQIEKWMYRIADNNKLSLTDARKLLNANQLAEFHWSVEEYIKYGQENAINQQWMKQLENASAKYHISRLEALKIQTQQSLEKAFGNHLDGVDSMVRKAYSEGYYRTAYELQKGFGIGWDIAYVDEKKLSKLIAKPWAADGKNFSDRIWQSKSQMVDELHKQLTRTCILGKSPDEAIKAMTKYVKNGVKNAKSQAARLIMTEQAFFASAAEKDSYQELGVEEYEIVATLDSHTSEICRELDGKHFPLAQHEAGVTAPPFHVRCRSTTCPYFDDEFTVGEMRAARDEGGKTYYVPADMKYPEWKRTFAEGGYKNGLNPVAKNAITEVEEGALLQYVSSDSYVVNDLLRRGEALTEQYAELVGALDSALTKLPKYEGTLIRDINFEDFFDKGERLAAFLSTFRVGEDRIFDEYISTTKFATYSPKPSVRIYIQDAVNGRDLGEFGESEGEVLYERGSVFTVLNVIERKGVYHILLGEKL